MLQLITKKHRNTLAWTWSLMWIEKIQCMRKFRCQSKHTHQVFVNESFDGSHFSEQAVSLNYLCNLNEYKSSSSLATLHSLLTAYPTLWTLSYWSTTTSMTTITYPMAQEPILSPTRSHTPGSTFHETLAPPCRPVCDLIAQWGISLLSRQNVSKYQNGQNNF